MNAKAEIDILSLDRSRLGPNGEEPWKPVAAPSFSDFVRAQQSGRAEKNGIGTYRIINPCPTSGRISFRQIADLRFRSRNIQLDDADLLRCRKPVATGNLDENYKPIYAHKDPPIYDPIEWRGGMWGHDYVVNRGESLPVNPINSWNEGFSSPYPTQSDDEEYGYSYRGVDTDGSSIRVYSASISKYVFVGWDNNNNPRYEWRFYPRATYATAYIGRVDPGTRLIFNFEALSRTPDWQYVGGSYQIRGSSEGFLGGDQMEYVSAGIPNSNDWISINHEIVVDSRFNDIYLAFQQNGSDSTGQVMSTYFRNYQIWSE